MATHVPLNEVKAKLSAMVGRAQDHHEEIVITLHGRPAAVLISAYQFESMRETLDILSDPESARELLFSGREDGEDYVAPAGATPGEILSELRSRQEQEQPATGAVALTEAMTSAKQAQAAAAEARRAADSARRSAVQAGAKAGHQRRSRAFRNVESGAARLRARREGGKTATDE